MRFYAFFLAVWGVLVADLRSPYSFLFVFMRFQSEIIRSYEVPVRNNAFLCVFNQNLCVFLCVCVRFQSEIMCFCALPIRNCAFVCVSIRFFYEIQAFCGLSELPQALLSCPKTCLGEIQAFCWPVRAAAGAFFPPKDTLLDFGRRPKAQMAGIP